jgi:hypothetical protein
MPELKISPNFTIEDIHKIREYDYEMTKGMTLEEENAYFDKGAEYCRNEIKRIREEKAKKQP